MNNNLLKNRSFLSVWMGNAVSEIGGAFGTFCNSILIYQLTGSKMALSSMWLLYFIPSLIIQLIIGPYIDRWSRKRIMIFSQWTRGLIFLIPLVSLINGHLVPWHIYAVQIIVGFITPIYTPANQAITPTIVAKEQISKANAYIDGTVRLMTFLSPILGGIVVQYIGEKWTLLFVSMLLILSGTLLLFIKEKGINYNVRKTWLEQFKDGVAYFFTQPIMAWLGIFLAFVQFGVGVTMVTTLPYVMDELTGTYTEYGYFKSGFPLGYVIGSVLVGKIKLKSRRVLMLGSLVIGGLTYVSLGFNHNIYFACTTEAIAGMVMAFFSVYNMTICQQSVPNHLMGKVFSVRLLIIRGVMPIGVGLGGVLSDSWGIRPLYILIGFIISAASLLGILLPYFRFLDGATVKKDAA